MKGSDGQARIHVPHNAPLNVNDTAEETMGCRATNPAICKNHGLADCAYCNAEHVCRLPPRGWKRRFLEMERA